MKKRRLMAPKTGTNAFFSKKLKRNPEALPLMNGGLKTDSRIAIGNIIFCQQEGGGGQ